MELVDHFTSPSCLVIGSTVWPQLHVCLLTDFPLSFPFYTLNFKLLTFCFSLKGEPDKKGFDNLANKEEQQKKEPVENQGEENQEKAKAVEDMASCEHQDQRERLAKEKQAENSPDGDGIVTLILYDVSY